MTDGSSVIGHVLLEEAETIRFRTVSGVEMTIARTQIKSVELLEGTIREGRYYRSDPNRTRLFFGPTARSLRTGQGYFSAYELFFPFAAVGVNNAVILSGGVSLIPGLNEQAVYAAPKVTVFQTEQVGVGVGTLVGTSTSFESYVGLAYAVGTIGQPDRALTFGLGFAFGAGEVETSPLIMVGGELQVSNSIKLLSENYLANGTVVVSGGLRFFGEQLAADLGLFTSPDLLDQGGFPFFPWLGFAYNFGR